MKEVIRYREIANIFIPLVISSMLTAVLGLIDSTMVLNYDSIAVSAVNVSTQLNQLFVPIIFGLTSGFAIFSVQFYEEKNYSKVKTYFYLSVIFALVISLFQFSMGFFFNEQIANFYFDQDLLVNQYVRDYTKILAFNAFFIAIEYAFVFQLRSSKKTRIIFISALIKSLANITFNFLLIYGNFGFPELGIKGAALATVLATLIGNIFLIFVAIRFKYPFICKDVSFASTTKPEMKKVFLTIWPLVIVELLFGLSRVLQTKEFSLVEFEQFNLMQIANMTMFILNAFITTSTTVASVVIGSALVHDNVEFSNKTLKKLHHFLFMIVGIVMAIASLILPVIYYLGGMQGNDFKTVFLILISNGLYVSFRVFTSSHLAILRAGGKTVITIFLDAGISFLVAIPVLYITYVLTDNIVLMKYALLSEGTVRIICTTYALKKIKWQNKMI